MRTIINRRFLIGLLIVALLLGAAVHGLHAFQVNRQSRFLLEEAHRAQQEQHFELTVNRYQQYTKLAPDDIDALAEYGLLLADHKAFGEAAVTLEKVLREQPDRDDVRRRLVSVEMAIGRVTDAKAHLVTLLKKPPGDALLWYLMGTCQSAGGEFADAAVSLEKSIARDPHQIDAYSRLAAVQRQLKHADKADESMKKLVEENPKSAPAHLLAGQYLASNRHASEAQKEIDAALDLAPQDPDALLLAARLVLDGVGHEDSRSAAPTITPEERAKARADNVHKQLEKARGFAQRAIDNAPTSPDGYILLARIETAAGNRKQAIDCLEDGVKQTQSRDPALLWELGRLRIESGDVAGTQAIIDTLHKFPAAAGFEPRIGYLEAQIELANRHWPAAIARLEQVAPLLSRSPDLQKEVRYQIAACQEKLGNTELELAAYREASRDDPNWPLPRLGVATTLTALGKFDEALEEYREIAKLDGMAGAGALGIVKLLIIKNVARKPADRDWNEADSLLDQLAQKNPDSVGVVLLRAEALVGEQNFPKAEELLLAARAKAPERAEIWQALIGLANRRQKWANAEQLLADAEKKFGDQVWLRVARGAILVARDKQASSPKLKALSDKAAAFLPADQFALARGLASLSLEAGDVAQATALARRACDADPQNLEARLFLFNLAFGSGDAAEVKQVLDEIRGLEGEGPLWHYGQAALCLLTKPVTPALDEAALEHIKEARKLRPGWPALSLLTARIEDRQEHSAAALQSYLEAIDLGDRNPEAIRRAVELLYAEHRYAEADQLLRRLEQQATPFTGDVEHLASEISARLEDLDRALEIARQLAVDSKNWRDHVWLGQLQSVAGSRAKEAGRAEEAVVSFADAEKSFRQAIRLKSETPEPWIALIRFYAVLGRQAEAETAIHEAERQLPAETAGLALAPCYEMIHDSAAAAKQYQAALAKSPQDVPAVRRMAEFEIRSGKLADAEAHLRSIVSGQIVAKPEEILLARREMAAVLRAGGSYPKIQQALSLIELNLAVAKAPDDLREKALLLSLCPQPERRREAIAILEGLLQAHPDADDLRIALTQFYVAASDWPRASKLLRGLVTSHEQDPRLMTLYVAQLLQNGETDEADVWIRRLEQIAPNEFATASLKAEARVARGQVDAGIQILKAALAQHQLAPAETTEQTRLVAARFEELARGTAGSDRAADATKLLAEAESMYRKYVEAQPDRQLVLAGFLARRGRFDESLALVESAGPKTDPNALAQVFAELLGSAEQGAGSGEQGAESQAPEPRAGRRQPPDRQAHAEVAPSASGLLAVGGRLETLLRTAIERNARAPALLIELADLRGRQERFDEAIKTYREVLEREPANVVVMNNLAMLLALEKQQLDEALSLINQAVAAAGPVPALLDTRASVYLALGRPGEALTDLDQVIAAEPRPNRQFHRSMACYQLGQTDAATQAFSEARRTGLKPRDLNPLERPAYRDLTAKLQ